jgi:hypothetical protein
MKKSMLALSGAILLIASLAYAQLKDWRDLDAVYQHVQQSVDEMQRAREANHYDMEGHGAKAEELLRQAEKELHLAVEAAKKESKK